METKNNLAIWTGDRLNESIFTSKCLAVLPGGQNKVAEITRWPYYRARGGTRYILAWGGAARPLIPWPCLRQISLIFHTLAGRTSPLSPYKGVFPAPPGYRGGRTVGFYCTFISFKTSELVALQIMLANGVPHCYSALTILYSNTQNYFRKFSELSIIYRQSCWYFVKI